MRLLAEKEKGVPDAQPLKSLVMVSRSHFVHYGYHTHLERQQWCRFVFHTNGDNLYRRRDAIWSSMGSIQSQPRTVGAHWRDTVARAPRRHWRSPLVVEVATWSGSRVSRARLATRIAYARVCHPTLHAPDAAPLRFAARVMLAVRI